MQINIDGKSVTRVLAIAAATVGVGAAAFFGGTATRMSDDAVANAKTKAAATAVESNTEDLERKHSSEVISITADLKAEQHEAVKKAIKKTLKKERKRAEKLAEQARNEGYSSGNTAGYASGNAAGHSAGVEEGIETASDELSCSDDLDVDLPPCFDW